MKQVTISIHHSNMLNLIGLL